MIPPMSDEIGKDFEGTACGPTEVLSGVFHYGLRKATKIVRISDVLA
jgi:hypothetical protein